MDTRFLAHDDLGKLILRLTVGIVVLLHGLAKLAGGVGGIAGMLSSAGLPAVFAYAVFLGEVLGPLLMIVGWYARIAALLVVANMVVAIALAHSHEIFALTEQGGWAIELQALMLFGALAVVFLGPGRWGVNAR